MLAVVEIFSKDVLESQLGVLHQEEVLDKLEVFSHLLV